MTHARIDPKLQRSAERIFTKLGISTTEAIRLFLKQVELHNGLPFPVALPIADSAALKRPRRDVRDPAANAGGGKAPELPVWNLGVRGSLHRRDIYDDLG